MGTGFGLKIKEIEKEIPNLVANDGCIDIDLGDNDFDKIKDYIEKKHKGISMCRLKLGKRKCVTPDWLMKLKE